MPETSAVTIIMAVLMGIGLSAAAGFKVFTPLLFVSVLAKFSVIPLSDGFMWLASVPAIIVLGTATVVEILCSFIPFIDNIMDGVEAPMAVIAGTLLTVSLLGALDPVWQWSLAIIAGGGTAGVIKSVTSAIKLGSSATTAGLANPLLAVAELSLSVVLTVLAVLAAPIAVCLAVLIVFLTVKFIIKLKNKFMPKQHLNT